MKRESKIVIVYSHERSSACRVVKEFLSQRGADFIVKNVVTDPEAREEFLRAGYRLPPVTLIAGVAVEGFQPDRLEELIEQI